MIALIGKKMGYNTLDFMAFLEVLWAGHTQSQLFPNKRSIENTTQPGACQSLSLPRKGLTGKFDDSIRYEKDFFWAFDIGLRISGFVPAWAVDMEDTYNGFFFHEGTERHQKGRC